jgi:hypothetical protein
VTVECTFCMRVMDVHGRPIGEKVLGRRPFDSLDILLHMIELEELPGRAEYDDRKSADDAARQFGWEVRKVVRCPECIPRIMEAA